MEDYKKLYEQSQESHKKTIERAISWAKGEHPECFSEAQKAIEFIFPELKESESEDEKVRKSLIDYFSNFHLQTFAGLDPKKILDWLEKQGEPELSEDLGEYIAELSKQFPEVSFAKLSRIAVRVKKWLEKQGNHKPIDKIQLGKKYKCIASPRYSTFRRGNIYKPVDNFLCNLMNLCYECFEPIEDSEQKPADKIEPKFHEGDIIQFNGFGHNRYTIKNVCGLSHYINTIGEKMDMSYTDANFEVIKDSDKNKLCRAWSEEDDYNVQCLVAKANCDIQKGNVGRNEELIDWLKSLRNRVKPQPDMVEALRTEYEKGRADVISEMKSSWSEEDETNSYHLKTLFENLAKDIKHEFRIISDNDRDKYTAWLKSLKDRIQPQKQ